VSGVSLAAAHAVEQDGMQLLDQSARDGKALDEVKSALHGGDVVEDFTHVVADCSCCLSIQNLRHRCLGSFDPTTGYRLSS